MVINCVPTPAARGDMLRRLFAHTRPGGLVFLMLPLRCLTHAKAMSWKKLVGLLQVTVKLAPQPALPVDIPI